MNKMDRIPTIAAERIFHFVDFAYSV